MVTKSNIRGMILPALGLSDWKHSGVVELYQKIAEQGYTLVYLTNRAIGQSDMTREYIYSLKEKPYRMPRGPVLLQVESLFGAFKTEVIKGQPEVNKIAALSRVKGLFPGNPFFSGFGNKAWDISNLLMVEHAGCQHPHCHPEKRSRPAYPCCCR